MNDANDDGDDHDHDDKRMGVMMGMIMKECQ